MFLVAKQRPHKTILRICSPDVNLTNNIGLILDTNKQVDMCSRLSTI